MTDRMSRAVSLCLYFAFIAAGPALVAPPPVLGQPAVGAAAVTTAAAAGREPSAAPATRSGGEVGSPSGGAAGSAEPATVRGVSPEPAARAAAVPDPDTAVASEGAPDGGTTPSGPAAAANEIVPDRRAALDGDVAPAGAAVDSGGAVQDGGAVSGGPALVNGPAPAEGSAPAGYAAPAGEGSGAGAAAPAAGHRAAGAATAAVTEKDPDGGSVPAPAAGALPESGSEPRSVAGPAPPSAVGPAPPSVAGSGPASVAGPAPPSASSATVPPAAADGEALARAYRRTGTAATVEVGERGAVALVPFGHGRPVLRCAPLRACAVELEAGEIVLATSLGDGARWLIQAAAAGPGARTPLLVVKPTACDLSTNLVVATDRRVYELALDSPPCRNADSGENGGYNPHLPYTGLVRFYYPDELVHRWAEQERLARQQAAEQAAGRTPLAPGARLAHLNFDYSWDRGKRWPWVPAQVFDDGLHTYLVLPPAARLAELPILLGVEPGGGLALLTYHLDGQTLIADRVLERAVLVVGHGRPKDEQRLEIANRAFGRRGGS
jgi:type IV secretion system protein TrbG